MQNRRRLFVMIGPSCPTILAERFRPHSYWNDLRGSAQGVGPPSGASSGVNAV